MKIIQRNLYFGISIAVILFSFWLSWDGVDWGLPDTRFGDEEAVVETTHRIPFRDDLVIGGKKGFWWCPAYNYLTGILFKIFDRAVVGTGLFQSYDFIPVWTHFLVARTLSILMSIGTLFVLMFLFKNVFGKFTALLAGLFFALNGTNLFRANIAHSDTMAVFLGTLTLYLSFKIMTTKGWTLYLLAGAVYGAAVASKLFAIGFFVPLFAGHFLAQTSGSPFSRMRDAVKDWRWLILPIAALGGYAVANPQSIIALGSFLKDVPAQLLGLMSEKNRLYKTVPILLGQIKRIYSCLLASTYSYDLTVHGSSLIALALTLIGSIVLFIRRFRLGLMMLIAFISVNLFLLPAAATYGHLNFYLIVVPICALLIGSAIDALWIFVIRVRLSLLRFLLCGLIVVALAFAVAKMLNKAIQVPNFKTGKGILSRRTDFRKWTIDHIPPGSRVAYDRYGTDLIPGYFDVVKKPGYDKGLDYFSQNFDYVIVSWDRINDYKVYEELLKRKPIIIFEDAPLSFMPRLAIYKMDRAESNQVRIRNFYTETLPRKMGIESTINDSSFENSELLESWAVRLFNPYQAQKHKEYWEYWKWEEIYRPKGKPIEWWDGENSPPYLLIERASDIQSGGKFSLHIVLGEDKRKENVNLISEEDSTFETEDKRIQIGQVIPYDFLDWLQYFSIDYYLPYNPAQNRPPGSVKLNFIAESIGGQYLNIETYVLYDSNEVQNPICGEWQTFNRNVKADFNKPFVRWKDIEFVIFFIEVENNEQRSLEIYIDNIQTAETFPLSKFKDVK